MYSNRISVIRGKFPARGKMASISRGLESRVSIKIHKEISHLNVEDVSSHFSKCARMNFKLWLQIAIIARKILPAK